MADETQSVEPTPVVLVEPEKRSIDDRLKAVLSRNDEPAEQPIEQPAEQPAEQSAEQPTEQPTEQPAEQTENQPVESAEPEEIEISSFAELAEHIGVDMAELYKIPIPMDIDGEHKEVSVGEWKDAYQTQERLNKEHQKAAQVREQMEAQAEELRVQNERAVLQSAKLVEKAEQRLMDDMNNVNWAQLREDDPSEWAAKRQDLQERQREIDAAKAEVETAFNAHVQEQKALQAQHNQEYLARERERLYLAIPEWRNEDVEKQEIADLRAYAGEIGFRPEEVDAVTDSRIIVLLRKARALDKQNAKVEVAKKKVVKIGKKQTATPGTANVKQQAQQDRNASLVQNLKKSGNMNDAAAVIAARMKR